MGRRPLLALGLMPALCACGDKEESALDPSALLVSKAVITLFFWESEFMCFVSKRTASPWLIAIAVFAAGWSVEPLLAGPLDNFIGNKRHLGGDVGGTIAGELESRASLAGLENYIEKVRFDMANVGIAIAVVKDEQVIFARGFGVKEHGKPEKIGPDTLFQIGSTTKAFTVAALGVLVDEGRIGWDDPVTNYLPSFQLQDPWITRHLTIRDLVAHRSGIREISDFVFRVVEEDAVVSQLRHAPTAGEFRDSYNYNNAMYAVAGKIIEAVSGQKWGEFIRGRLLDPLRMERSGTTAYQFWDKKYVAPSFWGVAQAGTYHHADAIDSDIAMPHLLSKDGTPHVIAWQSYDSAAGAGSLVSSANDLAKWLIMNLNDGRFEGRELLKEDTIDGMHSVQNSRYRSEFPFDESEGYAMGWYRLRYQDQVLLAHGGAMRGFPAYIAMMPERKIGVVILANGSTMDAGAKLHKAIALYTLDRLLGAPLRDWGQEVLAHAKWEYESKGRKYEEARINSRLKNAPPSLPLERYAGTYESKALRSGPVMVQFEGDRLTLKFDGEGALSGVLDPWHGDVFQLRPPAPANLGEYPIFVIGATGKVLSMSLFGTSYDRVPAGEIE